MTLLDRLMGWGAAPAPLPRVEPVVMAADTSGVSSPKPWMQDIGWINVMGGTRSRVKSLPVVSALSSQKHATVFACCSVIAGDLAKVPLHVYQRNATGAETIVRDHAASHLLNVESVEGVAAAVTRLALVYAFTLRGNGYAYAPRDGAGELELIEVVKGQSPAILRNGRTRFYQFEDGAQVQRTVPGRHMIHMRYMSDDGWTGRSPIEIAAESIGIAMAGQEAAARAASGTFVRAIIKLADNYADDEAEELAATRIANALRNPDLEGFPVMQHSEGIERLDLSASDQQLLESRKFDVTQICAGYRMPPVKVQFMENGVRANVEQQSIDYLTDCLTHWAVQAEGQLSMALLTPAERAAGLFLRHDLDALLRATTKDRYDAYFRAVGGPFMVADEARDKLGMKPIPGGDRLYPPSNMTRDENATTDKKDDAE
jgi:HK97 family phage portal protein